MGMGKYRILITEDDAVTALFIQKILESLGYEALGTANNGQEALEMCKNLNPDLVLMDISLPGEMDGISTAEFIHEKHKIPIIYVTGNIDNNTIDRAINSNSFGYIIKPIRSEQLFTMIEMTKNRHELEIKLRESTENLRILNEQLEEKVSERTQELNIKNIELEAEIDHRKIIEDDLKKSLAKEKELNELKSRIVSIISHELKTPLTTILSSTQLIEYHVDIKSPSHKVIQHIKTIERNVQELTELINDTLFLSKLEVQKGELTLKEINILNLIQNQIEFIEMGKGKEHNFNLTIADNIPVNILSDERLLKTILNNLLSNAVKYSPYNKDIKIDIFVLEENLYFSVADKGIGIPEKDKNNLFKLFHRASNTENIEGSGVGLSIIKRCLDLLNGTIYFESTEGKGTKFEFCIPLINSLKNEPLS